MVDAFLTVAAVVVLVLLLVVNTYLLALYQHPEDRGYGASVLPKIIVVLGLTLSWGQVLMLSLDISNTRGYGGGLNMDVFWMFAIFFTGVILLLVIPASRYYAETDEQKAFKSRVWSTAIYTGIIFACSALFILITFNMFGDTNIPVVSHTLPTTSLDSTPTTLIDWTALQTSDVGVKKTMKISVGLSVFVMAIFSVIGWVLLIFFGGMGFFSIPLDLIASYRNRPQNRSQKDILQRKIELQEGLAELLPRGLQIEESQKEVETARGFIAKRSAQANVNKDINRFKADVLLLEEDFEKFSGEVNYMAVNHGSYAVKLWAGVLMLIASLLWWFHILFNCITTNAGRSVSLFFNTILIWFDETLGLGFISTGIFTLLSIYLVVAVVQGNVKFGLKIPFFFTIHPMKQNETLMNSLLHNVWLMLATAVGIVQLLSATFTQYARLTSAEFLFGIVIKYMTFFRGFYVNNVFEIAFLCWSVLTLLSLLCFCVYGERKQQQKASQQKSKAKNGDSMIY